MTPTREDLAWAAGLYEGEGSICSSGPRNQVQLHLAMTDQEPVVEFARVFGLHVGPRKVSGHHLNKGWKPQWIARTGKFEIAQNAIAQMWPWLSPRRRDQAAAALSRTKFVSTKPTLCPSCGGDGWVLTEHHEWDATSETCHRCGGTGAVSL